MFTCTNKFKKRVKYGCGVGEYSKGEIFFAFLVSGGGMPLPGKPLFTASQRQELERQTLICKHLMAYVPVPPELLLPAFTNYQGPAPALVSKSSTSSLLSGPDPEPWRCRRTDGKKWRCSRNAVPDHKYCERHAHKSKPRSRKLVEIQSRNANATNNHTEPLLGLPTNVLDIHPSRKANTQFPTTGSASGYDRKRGNIEWFANGSDGAISVSSCNQQWQHLGHSSSSAELYQHRLVQNKEFSQQPYRNYKDQLTLMDNVGGGSLENHQLNDQFCNSILNSKMTSLQGSVNARVTHTPRDFVDTRSAAEEKGVCKSHRRELVSSGLKVPFSSLTLSMPGENEIDYDDDTSAANSSVGMMTGLERTTEEVVKSHWLNPVTWMGTMTPGGPLGEALCLGFANTSAKGSPNLPSPHGYSSSITTSSCSQSSCEDGCQALNFIGGNQ